MVCQSVEGEPYAIKLVGFVDREFREFDISQVIQDKLSEHKVQGRLVWSKGHSIENYFFDFSILRYPLTELAITEWIDEALKIFENLIDSSIRLACAAGLAARESKYIKPILNTINWEIIQIGDSQVDLSVKDWKKTLIDKQKLSDKQAENIVEQYIYWHSIIETTNFSVVRWTCHGHIGITTIWAVYIRCIYDVCRTKVKLDFAQESKNYSNIQTLKDKAAFQEAE